MVTTRSGVTITTASAVKIERFTTNASKADSKRLLGPKSRAKKNPPAPTLSKVMQNSHGRQQVDSRTKSTRNRQLVTTRGMEYIERPTDAAMTVSFKIRVGNHVGPPFRAPHVGHKRTYAPRYFSNIKGFKVGHNPFLHWKGPKQQLYWDYFKALKKRHDTGKEDGLKLNVTVDPITPGHAYTGDGHKFHALIEPIISCATSNINQKRASDSLYNNLKYHEGKVSKISPNYHKLRTLKKETFKEYLTPSGRQNNNAKYIMALFKTIRQENIAKRGLTVEEAAKIQEDAENAEDWTDGLLSLDFMVGMEMQEIFDKLVTYPGIACKTAACIMCFSFNFAIFAVDTHVFRLCQWAGWVPRNCNRDDAFKFLTIVIPPELHRDLHQALWHHAQRCYRCNGSTFHKVDNPKWKATVCPLEPLGLDRFPDWEKKSKAPPKKVVTTGSKNVYLNTDKDISDAKAAGHTIEELPMDDSFGQKDERSNTSVKWYIVLTPEQHKAFRIFQKTTVVTFETKTSSWKKTTIRENEELTIERETKITTMDAIMTATMDAVDDGENDGENDI